MYVGNINFSQNNNRYNQSFAGIRQVKCSGLYKKYPELGKEMVDTFKDNPKVMDFCIIQDNAKANLHESIADLIDKGS